MDLETQQPLSVDLFDDDEETVYNDSKDIVYNNSSNFLKPTVSVSKKEFKFPSDINSTLKRKPDFTPPTPDRETENTYGNNHVLNIIKNSKKLKTYSVDVTSSSDSPFKKDRTTKEFFVFKVAQCSSCFERTKKLKKLYNVMNFYTCASCIQQTEQQN